MAVRGADRTGSEEQDFDVTPRHDPDVQLFGRFDQGPNADLGLDGQNYEHGTNTEEHSPETSREHWSATGPKSSANAGEWNSAMALSMICRDRPRIDLLDGTWVGEKQL